MMLDVLHVYVRPYTYESGRRRAARPAATMETNNNNIGNGVISVAKLLPNTATNSDSRYKTLVSSVNYRIYSAEARGRAPLQQPV